MGLTGVGRAPLYPARERLFEESRESGARSCAPLHALQFLPDSRQLARYPHDGGGRCRPCLELGRGSRSVRPVVVFGLPKPPYDVVRLFAISVLSLTNILLAWNIGQMLKIFEAAFPGRPGPTITTFLFHFQPVLIGLAFFWFLSGVFAYTCRKGLLGYINFLVIIQMATSWYAWLAPLFVHKK